MREIKFKLWLDDSKSMSPPGTFDDWLSATTAIGRGGKKNDKSVWLQCTDIKDRAGTPIYEGDIIEYFNQWGGTNKAKRREIIWRNNRNYVGFNIGNGDNYEIIGNIYENRDLLK